MVASRDAVKSWPVFPTTTLLMPAECCIGQPGQIGQRDVCDQHLATGVLLLPVLALLLQTIWKPFYFSASAVQGYSRNSAETYLFRTSTAGHDLTDSLTASSFTASWTSARFIEVFVANPEQRRIQPVSRFSGVFS